MRGFHSTASAIVRRRVGKDAPGASPKINDRYQNRKGPMPIVIWTAPAPFIPDLLGFTFCNNTITEDDKHHGSKKLCNIRQHRKSPFVVLRASRLSFPSKPETVSTFQNFPDLFPPSGDDSPFKSIFTKPRLTQRPFPHLISGLIFFLPSRKRILQPYSIPLVAFLSLSGLDLRLKGSYRSPSS